MKKPILLGIYATLGFLLSGTLGCGESNDSPSKLSATEKEELSAAILQAQVEYQIATYKVIKALSNDHQNGFLEVEPTDIQIEEIEAALIRMEPIAQNAIDAYEKLSGEPVKLALSRLRSAAPLSQRPMASWKNWPLVGHLYNLANQSSRRKKEVLAILTSMNESQKSDFYNDLAMVQYRSQSENFDDFVDQIKAGKMNDSMWPLHQTVLNAGAGGAAASSMNLDRANVAKNEGAKLIVSGAKTLAVVAESGGSPGKMAVKLVTKSLLQELVDGFKGFFSNKDKVMHREINPLSPYANLDPEQRLETAVEEKLTNANEVVDMDATDTALNAEDSVVIKPVDAHSIAQGLKAALVIAEKIPAVFPPPSTIVDGVGYASIITGQSEPVEGFVMIEQQVPTAAYPNWILGLGAGGGSAIEPVWAGALPIGAWNSTLVTPTGNESETVTLEVNATTPVSVEIAPTAPTAQDNDTAGNNNESSWFDWVQYVDEDGNGIPFGGGGDDNGGEGEYNASCNERSQVDGTCTDYLGINDEMLHNLNNGCQGVVYNNSLCDTTGLSFSCAMNISAYGDAYVLKYHVYNADGMPIASQQTMCDNTCKGYATNSSLTITNCRME